jgi:hypothetical protein
MSQNERRDRERGEDWAKEVPWERSEGPYRDYGWEKGQSILPEFRDPDVHVQPYERQRVSRWRKVNWNKNYNYGIEEVGPYSGVGPKDYRRSDQRIYEDVCERLTQHGRIDARGITVNVKDGEVTLDGTVRDRPTKRMAEDVADQVSGVKDVHNQLRIEQLSGQDMTQNPRNSGMPGGGQGRADEVGRSGVYPASGPLPPENAPAQGQASWGQGERGPAGYDDSGRSELNIPPENEEKE